MLDLNALQQLAPGLSLGFVTPSKSASSSEPREVLAQTIDNSLALLANPGHTVTRRGKAVKPAPCFKIDAAAGTATIVLRYSHEALVLTAQGNTSIVVPVTALAPVLNTIKQQVLSGNWDAALQGTKQKRVAGMKKGIANKKAKKQSQTTAPVAANTDTGTNHQAA